MGGSGKAAWRRRSSWRQRSREGNGRRSTGWCAGGGQEKRRRAWQAEGGAHRKNCEPLVPGPALAMERVPGPVCLSEKFSSANLAP